MSSFRVFEVPFYLKQNQKTTLNCAMNCIECLMQFIRLQMKVFCSVFFLFIWSIFVHMHKNVWCAYTIHEHVYAYSGIDHTTADEHSNVPNVWIFNANGSNTRLTYLLFRDYQFHRHTYSKIAL